MPRRRTVLACGLAALAATGGCFGRAGESDLRIMVPNAPGSGYDLTARTIATALDTGGVERGVDVFNLPGAGGAVGLQRLAYERGNVALLMIMGLGLIGARHTAPAAAGFDEVTPIAQLIEDPEIIVVTHDSPLAGLDDLVRAWAADPDRLPVGGGSAPGGPDHLATMLIAKAVGLDPVRVRYVRHDGGGALLAAILAKRVGFAVSSLGEYAEQIGSGQLRVLAVTSRVRADGVDAPTLREAGVAVEFLNWRGVLAPPGLPRSGVARLRDLMERLHAAGSWRTALAAHRWTDAYLPGDEFGDFLAAEDARVLRILTELGLR